MASGGDRGNRRVGRLFLKRVDVFRELVLT